MTPGEMKEMVPVDVATPEREQDLAERLPLRQHPYADAVSAGSSLT